LVSGKKKSAHAAHETKSHQPHVKVKRPPAADEPTRDVTVEPPAVLPPAPPPAALEAANPAVYAAAINTTATLDLPVFTPAEATVLAQIYKETSAASAMLPTAATQRAKTSFYVTLEDIELRVLARIGQVLQLPVHNMTVYLQSDRKEELAAISDHTAVAEAYLLSTVLPGYQGDQGHVFDEQQLGDVTLVKQIALEVKRLCLGMWSQFEVKFSNMNAMYYQTTSLQSNMLLADQLAHVEHHQFRLLALYVQAQQATILNLLKHYWQSVGRAVTFNGTMGLCIKKKPGELALPDAQLRDAERHVATHLHYAIKLVSQPHP
jgi:hypothetical protein